LVQNVLGDFIDAGVMEALDFIIDVIETIVKPPRLRYRRRRRRSSWINDVGRLRWCASSPINCDFWEHGAGREWIRGHAGWGSWCLQRFRWISRMAGSGGNTRARRSTTDEPVFLYTNHEVETPLGRRHRTGDGDVRIWGYEEEHWQCAVVCRYLTRARFPAIRGARRVYRRTISIATMTRNDSLAAVRSSGATKDDDGRDSR